MIQYRELELDELSRELFGSFHRRQVVTKCWRREMGQWVIKDDPFIDDWNEDEYKEIIDGLKETKKGGGLVLGAFLDGGLKGFVSVEGAPIGSREQYMDLSCIYVSDDVRRLGIGRELFLAAKAFAGKKGAESLYISGHSAVESQAFYHAMGCAEAEEYYAPHVEKEPYDCQLECKIEEAAEERNRMDIRIPAPAEEILEKLNEHGYEAYIVGGCVRDMILGREPGDWDITTSALPQEVKAVFRRTVDTGIQHGTVTVMIDKEGYEVTTYRIDGEYSDGRHPNSVTFTPDLVEDLKRRDFTINAMAYNSRTGFVDAFGGVEDLENKIIRCVGNPMDRFTEDALRILRAIRFSAQLGFEIEENTYSAIRAIAPNMVHVSKERIQTELTKLLLSRHPERMELVYETGISPYVSEAFSRILPPWFL